MIIYLRMNANNKQINIEEAISTYLFHSDRLMWYVKIVLTSVYTQRCIFSYYRKELIKEYRMVFRAGLRDRCTRDVARFLESVKILEPQASVFLRSPKVESAWIMLSCLENSLVFVL